MGDHTVSVAGLVCISETSRNSGAVVRIASLLEPQTWHRTPRSNIQATTVDHKGDERWAAPRKRTHEDQMIRLRALTAVLVLSSVALLASCSKNNPSSPAPMQPVPGELSGSLPGTG